MFWILRLNRLHGSDLHVVFYFCILHQMCGHCHETEEGSAGKILLIIFKGRLTKLLAVFIKKAGWLGVLNKLFFVELKEG